MQPVQPQKRGRKEFGGNRTIDRIFQNKVQFIKR